MCILLSTAADTRLLRRTSNDTIITKKAFLPIYTQYSSPVCVSCMMCVCVHVHDVFSVPLCVMYMRVMCVLTFRGFTFVCLIIYSRNY